MTTRKPTQRGAGWIVCYLVVAVIGCRGATKIEPRADATLTRFAKDGRESFAEGQVDVAIRKYRDAIHRAWAMDDPYESGTNAYNLAACLTSESEITVAKDWLLDARIELCRAGSTHANVWLLEAKIAQRESRFDDARVHVNRAACAKPPCAENEQYCMCCNDDPCRESCVTQIPCIGSKIRDKQRIEDCKDETQIQIHLARASIAADQFDTASALRHFGCACELLDEICSYELRAELNNVAGRIHAAKGEYLCAAVHFDKEAEYLRLAGIFREIPGALQQATDAYELAERVALAADRRIRIARIWFGRGNTAKAWSIAQQVLPMIDAAGHCAEIRLALLAHEIEQAMQENEDDPKSDTGQELYPDPFMSPEPIPVETSVNEPVYPDAIEASDRQLDPAVPIEQLNSPEWSPSDEPAVQPVVVDPVPFG